MRGLHDKVVVITGATGVIGTALARRFVAEGSRTVAWGRDRRRLDELCTNVPGLAHAVVADVACADEVSAAFDDIVRGVGAPAVVVNNAGVNARERFVDIPIATWRHVMAVNADGAFLVAQQAARRMSTDGGAIINVASTNGLVGYRDHAAYSSSKAALVELTRCIALDLAPAIRVNAVCPGFVESPMLSYGPEVTAQVPAGRFGQAREIAALCAFLASSEARFITGQAIAIDGGELAGGTASLVARAGAQR